MVKHGCVGNAYRAADKVNIPELQGKLQRRIDVVTETAKRLAESGSRAHRKPAGTSRGRSAPKDTVCCTSHKAEKFYQCKRAGT
jgi:hypothetical protein